MNPRLNEIGRQDKRVFLITGANSGLGYETSKFLLKKGATVIMCCRDLKKGGIARQELLKFKFSGNIELFSLDLSDLKKVEEFAQLIKTKFNSLDVLINNAGIMAPPKTFTKQGFEIQFGVNHLAHMFLTLQLQIGRAPVRVRVWILVFAAAFKTLGTCDQGDLGQTVVGNLDE